ncbi:MAG: hypothetical protein ABSC55_01930 [Syntrophorhabdales bacterium]|jgi:hypothetical protein
MENSVPHDEGKQGVVQHHRSKVLMLPIQGFAFKGKLRGYLWSFKKGEKI